MTALSYNARGKDAALNQTADAVIKSRPGKVATVNVIVAGSAVGALHDTDTVANAATANKVFVIPNTVGTYAIDWPFATGVVLKIGTGQTVAISYF